MEEKGKAKVVNPKPNPTHKAKPGPAMQTKSAFIVTNQDTVRRIAS